MAVMQTDSRAVGLSRKSVLKGDYGTMHGEARRGQGQTTA